MSEQPTRELARAICDKLEAWIVVYNNADPELGAEAVEVLARLLDSEAARVRLEHAIEWELYPETSESTGDHISLVRRDGFKGRRWAIKQRGYVLNKSGEWEYEPIPSSRTDEWLDTVRWDTPEQAIAELEKAKGKP
jgi:hypothetical protein